MFSRSVNVSLRDDQKCFNTLAAQIKITTGDNSIWPLMTAGSRILLWLIMFRVQYSMSSFPGIKVCIYKVPRQFSGEITYRCRWRQQVQRWWTHLSSQSWETLLTLVGVGVRRPPFDGLFLITDIVQFTLNLVNVGNKVCHEMRMRYDVIRNRLNLGNRKRI